jgi:ParB family transcriptional regulator, chromosome partitioning protein
MRRLGILAGMPPRKKPVRRRKVSAASVGLAPGETGDVDAATKLLEAQIDDDGGRVIGSFRDPFGSQGAVFAVLPLDRVQPTPYQRDPSDAHVKRLMTVIEKVGSFLDPIITIRKDDAYWTPNGNHRLQALKRLGVKSITALVLPDPEIAFKILALNTEKAHNLREKSLEVIRMARALADERAGTEADHSFEFEQPSLLTLGVCYEERPKFSGGAYQPLLRRIDEFLDEPIRTAVRERQRRGRALLAVDDAVGAAVEKLKAKGFVSPYLRPFVVARVNPIRFSKAESFDFDEVIAKMRASAAKFNADKVRQEDLARTGGPPDAEQE